MAVDGQPVDPVHGPAPLLADAAGKPVELTVRSGTEVRRVAVVPLHSERRLRYQDWVAGRRRQVRELSNGRLGYLHVPDMVGTGWAHFSRDLRTEMDYEGLIIDVRSNGGGHISQLVLEKLGPGDRLGRDPVAPGRVLPAWMRGAARWWRWPTRTRPPTATSSPRPSACSVSGRWSAPVPGAAWSASTRSRELVDGTRITVPQLAFSFDQLGWGVENYGVDPDVEVDITPADWAQGRDPQLETAVRLALEALDKQPATSPPDPRTGPRKARPPLPPRPARNTLA